MDSDYFSKKIIFILSLGLFLLLLTSFVLSNSDLNFSNSRNIQNSFLNQTNTLSDNLFQPAIRSQEQQNIFPISEIETASRIFVEGEILVKYNKNEINLTTSHGITSAQSFATNHATIVRSNIRKDNISLLKILDGKTVEEKIIELEQDPSVEYVQPNYIYYPFEIPTNDTHRNLLWGLKNTGQTVNSVSGTVNADINAVEAWAISEGSPIVVAVIDSGVAYNHPDLAVNMWDGSSCKDYEGSALNDCVHGYDFEDDDKTPLPAGESHGTHVAGTIAAIKNNSIGIIGVAPNAEIMALKAGGSSFTTDRLINAINFARHNDANIINASWGNYESDPLLSTAIENFPGLFIAAAGNSGIDHDSTPGYPCGYGHSNIICVAATDQFDELAIFGSTGASDYGANSVHIGAPGKNIYSTIQSSTGNALEENFNSLTPPNTPGGWTKAGINENWGTWDTSHPTWGVILYGDIGYPYANNTNSTITTPTQNLSSIDAATINFLTQCETEYNPEIWTDYMALEISSDGTTFTEILRWDQPELNALNLANYGVISDAYYFENINIPTEYLTSNFRLQFRWVTNESDNEYDGCSIGELSISTFDDGSGEEYAFMSGTSMAAPHVSGLAALLWSYKTDLNYLQVKNLILISGDSLDSMLGTTITGMRINAAKTLEAASTPPVTDVNTMCIPGWNNSDQTIQLIANDVTGIGVANTQYRLNNGSWQDYTVPIVLTTDLNHRIDYNSIDNAGNVEETKTFYCAIDKTPPTINIDNNPGSTWQGADFNIIIDLNYDISGLQQEIILVNGSPGIVYTDGTKRNIEVSTDGNNLVSVVTLDNANNYSDLNFYSALDKTAPDVVFSTTNDLDVLYGLDQNVNINFTAPIENSLYSGVASLDINFYDINGLNDWVPATMIDENNFYFNTGDDWSHDFKEIILSIKVTDLVGNYLITDLNTPIVLYDFNIPQGLGGTSTNFQDINNFEIVQNLTFEKVGLGKIVFNEDVNLLNLETVEKLKSIELLLDINNMNTELYNPYIDLNTNYLDFLSDLGAVVTMYNLPFDSEPGIIYYIDENNPIPYDIIDANSLGNYSWVDNNLTFFAQGFSKYEFDGNAPEFNVSIVEVNDLNALIRIQSNELAKCKYDSNSDLNYTEMNYGPFLEEFSLDFNIPITQLASDTDYNFYFQCIDLAGNYSQKIVDNNASFTTDVDITDPILSVGTITKTTSSATIPLTLNEPAVCRYKQGNDSNYDEMTSPETIFSWNDLTKNIVISGLSASTNYTYTITCRDDSNNDGNVTTTFTTNAQQTSTGGSPGGGGPSGGVGISQTPQDSITTISETTQEIVYSQETLEDILSQMTDDNEQKLFTSEEIKEMVENTKNYVFEINSKVEKIVSDGKTSYKTTITTKITNNSRIDQKDVVVVIEVPKEITETAQNISSGTIFKILKDDPIIEFTIPLIRSGQTFNLEYEIVEDFNPNLEEINFNNPSIRFLEEYKESIMCPAVWEPVCGVDGNTYSNACYAQNAGVAIDYQGECEEEQIKDLDKVKDEELQFNDWLIWVLILILILLVFGIAYYKRNEIQKLLTKNNETKIKKSKKK